MRVTAVNSFNQPIPTRVFVTDVYVLKLENGNYYVGKTDRGEKRLKEHVKGRGAEWTKMHKPKKIHAYHRNAGDSGEKKVFNQMVKKYGAKKVRGAHFTKRKASAAELRKMEESVGLKKKTGRRTKSNRKTPAKKTTTRKTTTKRKPKAKTAKSPTKKKSKTQWIAPSHKKDRFGRIVPKTARDYAAEKKSKSTTAKKKSTTRKKTTTRKKASSSPKKKTTRKAPVKKKTTTRKTTTKRKTSTRRASPKRSTSGRSKSRSSNYRRRY